MTAPTTAQAARLAAIERSGWGERFRLVQPHNLAFWVYALLVGVGGFVVISNYIVNSFDAYGQAITAGLLVFALYTVPFWWFLRRSDRYSTIPGSLAIAAFVYGGFAATGAFALYGNNSMRSLWGKGVSQAFAFDWSAALTAPVVEELAKGSGLILLLAIAPKIIRTPFDGLIVGAFLGLGFQIIENIGYITASAAAGFGADQTGAIAPTLGVRIFAGIASHWAYSAIFCAGLVYFVGRPDAPAQRGKGLGLIALAMLIHGTWDAAAALAAGSPALGLLSQVGLPVLLLGVLVAVYRSTAKTERSVLPEILAPEVELGIVRAEEVDALVAPRKERRAFVKAAHGHRDRVVAKHVLHAVLDLADQLAKDRGQDTPAVQHARSEVTRVRA
jgi:protease PrsW